MCTFEKKDEILKLLKEYQVLTNLLKPGRLNSEHFVLAEPKRIIIKQLNFLDLLTVCGALQSRTWSDGE